MSPRAVFVISRADVKTEAEHTVLAGNDSISICVYFSHRNTVYYGIHLKGSHTGCDVFFFLHIFIYAYNFTFLYHILLSDILKQLYDSLIAC